LIAGAGHEWRTLLLRLHPRQPPSWDAVHRCHKQHPRAHRAGRGSQFVKKYGVFRLVHVEVFATPQEAIAREKQLKFWKRDGKIKLIEQENPDWNDRSGLI
jgi:predicted GIY-YIG superfamily endonuclease